jgi:non-specific serine/threonine protein kinase
MKVFVLHGKSSAALAEDLEQESAFLTITTYGMASRIEGLQEHEWDCLILDEAQAIKNPGTKQTLAIKKIPARMRIALTGTPIENDLFNLWSIFDFLNKGLLGTSGQFREYARRLGDDSRQYAHLRRMISPFMLRRMKTDKAIIADLPEKMEIKDHTELSAKQIVLYRKVVAEMETRIQSAESQMDRRGLVLATIMKLKQICNHPDQYLGQPAFAPSQSGKFAMLRELCETISEKRERVLVFTQFKEMCGPLADFLTSVFRVEGFVLHGGTPVKERGRIVEAFQGDAYVPFMVLSVKAGGTGLNLTRASHVIHFDRWWNPAVENQATDRAFRIGQKNNVMVHKLISTGTIEEKIDAIIESKKDLAENVIGGGGEHWITEMNDAELHELLRLEV